MFLVNRYLVSVVELVFWQAPVLVVYPFLGYPLLLHVANKFRGQGVVLLNAGSDADDVELLPVTLIISAFNEAVIINRKQANALSFAYPHDFIEIIVISGGGADSTTSIVSEYSHSALRVQLLKLQTRAGKTAGLE